MWTLTKHPSLSLLFDGHLKCDLDLWIPVKVRQGDIAFSSTLCGRPQEELQALRPIGHSE